MQVIDDQQHRPAATALQPAQHPEEPGRPVIAGRRTGLVLPQQPVPAGLVQHLGQHAERKRALHRMPPAETHPQPRRGGQGAPAVQHRGLAQPRLAHHEQRPGLPGTDRADQPGDGLGHAVALQQPATARHHVPSPKQEGEQTKP